VDGQSVDEIMAVLAAEDSDDEVEELTQGSIGANSNSNSNSNAIEIEIEAKKEKEDKEQAAQPAETEKAVLVADAAASDAVAQSKTSSPAGKLRSRKETEHVRRKEKGDKGVEIDEMGGKSSMVNTEEVSQPCAEADSKKKRPIGSVPVGPETDVDMYVEAAKSPKGGSASYSSRNVIARASLDRSTAKPVHIHFGAIPVSLSKTRVTQLQGPQSGKNGGTSRALWDVISLESLLAATFHPEWSGSDKCPVVVLVGTPGAVVSLPLPSTLQPGSYTLSCNFGKILPLILCVDELMCRCVEMYKQSSKALMLEVPCRYLLSYRFERTPCKYRRRVFYRMAVNQHRTRVQAPGDHQHVGFVVPVRFGVGRDCCY
jgi:hypothetical protein